MQTEESVFVGDFRVPSAPSCVLWLLAQGNRSRALEFSLTDAMEFAKSAGLSVFNRDNVVALWEAVQQTGLNVPDVKIFNPGFAESVVKLIESGAIDPSEYTLVYAKAHWVVVGPEAVKTPAPFLKRLAGEGGRYSFSGSGVHSEHRQAS